MSTFLRDCRLAFRSMMKRKALSALLVVTLGLGLGSNIAMFSMFDVLLIRPLNFPNLDRLVRVWEVTPTSDAYDRSNASPADFLDWKAQSGDVFESLVAMEDWDANLRAGAAPERVQAFKVSPEYFESLGIKPVLGRGFRADEGSIGNDGRAILSFGLWQRTFAGNPEILGTEVLIDGKSYTSWASRRAGSTSRRAPTSGLL